MSTRGGATDAEGYVKVPWIESGTCRVRCEDVVNEEIQVDASVERTFHVAAVTRIGGVILGPGGAPLSGAQGLSLSATFGDRERLATVDEAGRWGVAVAGDVSGPVVVRMSPAVGGPPPETLVQPGDVDHRWHVPLTEVQVGVRCSGRTRCLGSVALRGAGEWSTSSMSHPIDPASGFATFRHVMPGRYTAQYRAGRAAPERAARSPIDVLQGTAVGPQRVLVEFD